ncbi:uncharacterized protein LOC143275864 isoform X2 [Babylonia areolata]|uniref:uncharacterized protein LOC143275864 isoform X2 n=1 Tax=Babylonia areolata TaxID=304850 RepID=UPI003FD32CAA
MAMTGVRDGFELDDHGILRDSFASDFHVDEDGILHDDLDLLKHAINTASHGTDSGISGDKPSSTTSTLQHLHASFDEDLAPIGDESINISDFEASRDDLDSNDGDLDGNKRSRSHNDGAKRLAGAEGVSGRSGGVGGGGKGGGEAGGGQELFSEEYYQQLRELGVLVDGADFSRDESQTELEGLESQLSHDHAEYDDFDNGVNGDLIGEYLQEGYSHGDRGNRKVPDSQGTSVPSVSAFSDDMDMMYAGSQTADDDEIFLINHQLLPGSSNIQAEKLPVTPSDHGSRPGSMAALRGQSPRGSSSNKRRDYRSKGSPSPSESGPEMYNSRSGANTPHRTRPDSAISFTSAASESVRLRSGASTPAKSSMSKARSQESFFEQGKQPGKGGAGEKHPKRLLPKPSAADPSQSAAHHRKSKSVSNIANRSAPLKPTHMSISEITRITLDEAGDASVSAGEITLDRSEGELTTQLKQESSKRKQATELVQQLQKEYDTLLSKYALAELTIDQMRLGARITLHADSPTPSSVQSGGMSPSLAGHKAHMFQIPGPSAQRAVTGSFSSVSGEVQTQASTPSQTVADVRSRSASTAAEKTLIAVRSSLDAGGQGSLGDSEDRTSIKASGSAETVKLTIQTQTLSLNDRLDQFHTLLENRQLTLEEQEKAFENIRTDHEKLRRSYLQAKEDYNVLRRSGAGLPNADFDGDKELEGQLFRLGMRFDEVHEKVDTNLKQQAAHRQPFQTSHLTHNHGDAGGVDDVDQGGQLEGHHGSQSEDSELEKRAEQLHEEYRALMDRYRRLKQMVPTPELNKETDNLVRKLNSICVEMPDMFRLAPEVQERWEKLQRRDQRRSPQPQSREEGGEGAVGGKTGHGERNGRSPLTSASKVRGMPLMGDHSISPFPSRHHDSRDSRMDDSFTRTPSSLSGSRSSLASPRDLNSSTVALRSSASPSPRDADRGGSPSSLDGAAAPRTRDSYDARINRPRRHHHNFHDPKSSKRAAERGSRSSLADSGLSDAEGRDRERRPPDDALAQLPGPGKMKQLTHQRRDNDVDSGFVGSMVSTEGVQQPPPPSGDPHRPPHQEPTLRLRERPPTDRNHDRSRRDSSASASTVTSTRRDSGGEGSRSRHARPPRAVTTSSSAGAGHRSIDRSYDGELDESTLSHALDRDRPNRGARPKEPASRPKATEGKGEQHRGKMEEAELSGSQSMRSQSDSMQDDETLEDMTEGDITDVSTPRLIEAPADDTQTKKTSTQPPQTSQPPPPHPPSPREAAPPRPPTPYRVEAKEGSPEVGTSQEEAPPVEEEKPQQQQQQQQQQQESPKPQAPTAAPPPVKQPSAKRPGSRGEPTTDLFHTRPRRERKRDRGQDAESVTSVESSRPGSRRGRRDSEASLRATAEDRGVGSDLEVRSDLTRVSSVHSARLRAMQDEIEKLKEGVQLAHDKASERRDPLPLPPPPPPQQQQQQPEGPEYYDPFDDPYGFMRMPRRRANSFSGGRVREFDEWYWTLPNERRHDDEDIPLGYAAADAYNRHYREKTPEAAARQRLRRRGDRRHHGEEVLPPPPPSDPRGVVNGGGGEGVVGAPPLHATPPTTSAPPTSATLPLPPGASAQMARRQPPPSRDRQALYNYYVTPRKGQQQGESMPPATAPTHTHTLNLNPYRQHTTPLSTSQPNLSQTLAGVEPSYLYQQQQQQTSQQARPWYTIRRSPWSSASAQGGYQGGYQPDPHSYYHQQQGMTAAPNSGYYSAYTSSEPSGHVQGAAGYWTDVCPLCGGSGAHTHEEDGFSAEEFGAEYRYPFQGRSRRRSRTMSRSRLYSPDGRRRSHHSYHVKEFRETDSEGSYELERGRRHRRSRSWSRHRSHSPPRRSLSRHSSLHRDRRRRRKREQLSLQEDHDLNESLMLAEDMGRLTKRMMGTVRGELRRYSESKDFGSADW